MATTLRMGCSRVGGRGGGRKPEDWGGSRGELLSGEWISQRPTGQPKSGFSERAAPDPPSAVTFTIEFGQEPVCGGCVGLPRLYPECLVLQLIKQ